MKLKTGQVRALNKTLMVAFLVSFLVAPEAALPQTPFYQGKTLTIIQGRDPGGTGDMRVRAMTPFLQKYIPGNPTVVSEYMPGGGSRKAASALTGSLSETWGSAWFRLLSWEKQGFCTISISFSIWALRSAAITLSL